MTVPLPAEGDTDWMDWAEQVDAQGRRALTLRQLAANPLLMLSGAITPNATPGGKPTAGAVVWPDGTPGTYTATTVAASGAIDAYTVTYGSPATKTFTQPAVTRNGAGDVTNRPAIVES